MIGPAEIDELMAEHAEDLKNKGTNVPEALTWPLTYPSATTQQFEPISLTLRLRWSFTMLSPETVGSVRYGLGLQNGKASGMRLLLRRVARRHTLSPLRR